ncbi:hypothetical protein SCHPADRAFT_549647 [Schizopora paradoxa]|uniref:Uncharacterized protein n=1 Tax=Schizopora paradoxa TaxID=27342 RepID=A0A0H2RJY3_9AGAM|nr:hypothetical protein SCHPADRAFT_549647 [Schizopora paradoxa]
MTGIAMAPSFPTNTSVLRYRCAIQSLPLDTLIQIFALLVAADFSIANLDFRGRRIMMTRHYDDSDEDDDEEGEEDVAQLEERQGFHSIHLAPRNVSQVCRRWRAVILDSSLLWSMLSIKTSDIYREGFTLEHLVSVVKDRLRKSGNAPLTVSLGLGYSGIGIRDFREPGDAFHTFIDTVASERQRWKKVYIVSFLCPSRRNLPVFNDLPLLEELSICIPVPWDDHDVNSSTTTIDLSTCGELKTLKLDGKFEFISDGTVLKKLAHVEFTRHTNSPFSSHGAFTALQATFIAQLAPALVTLILDVFPSKGSSLLRPIPLDGEIRLEHLRELRIKTYDKVEAVLPEVAVFFNRLILPSLKVLEVELENHLDVASLINRSGCSIATLCFDASRGAMPKDESEALIVSWLSRMPELQELTIDNVEISSSLIAHLVLSRSAPGETGGDDDSCRIIGLCPSLKNLRLIQCDFYEWGLVRNFVNMLRSRLREAEGSVGKMEKFYAGDCDIRDIMKHTAVREWMAQGIDLDFY